MATLFFRDIFGEGIAPKVMAALIAFSIFGSLVVMTFTASRGMVTCPEERHHQLYLTDKN